MVGRFLYWLAVLVVSVALLIALVLFFESRDQSSLRHGGGAPVASTAAPAPRA